jgi:hypothetical protein
MMPTSDAAANCNLSTSNGTLVETGGQSVGLPYFRSGPLSLQTNRSNPSVCLMICSGTCTRVPRYLIAGINTSDLFLWIRAPGSSEMPGGGLKQKISNFTNWEGSKSPFTMLIYNFVSDYWRTFYFFWHPFFEPIYLQSNELWSAATKVAKMQRPNTWYISYFLVYKVYHDGSNRRRKNRHALLPKKVSQIEENVDLFGILSFLRFVIYFLEVSNVISYLDPMGVLEGGEKTLIHKVISIFTCFITNNFLFCTKVIGTLFPFIVMMLGFTPIFYILFSSFF